MPKIQRYLSSAPQQEVPVIRIPEAPAMAMGEGMRNFGAALGQLSDALLDQAKRERDVEDEAQVRQVMNQEREAALQFKMDAEQNKLGQAGLKIFDETGTYFQERKGQAAGQLTSDRQRTLFDRDFSQLQNAYGSWAADWQTLQLKTFQKSTLLAESQQITDAAQRDQAPAALELYAHGDATPWAGLDAMAGKLSQNVRRMYADDGYGPEVLDSLVKDETTKFHQRILADMLMTSPKAAKAYLEAHGDQISGDVQIKLKEALKSATADQEAYDAASAIMGEHGKAADFSTYASAAKKAAGGDAGVERRIMSWVESFYSVHKKEREEARQNTVLLVDENVQKLLEAGDVDGLKKYKARVEQIGDLATRTASRRIVDQGLSGKDVVTDPDAYAQAMKDLGSAPTFDAKAFQSKYLLKIGREDLKDLVKMGQDAAGARVARKLAEVTASLKDLGLTKAEERTLFNRTIKSFVDEYRATHGQNPSDQEIQDEVDRQTAVRVYDEDFLFDDTVRQFKMHSVEIGDVPKKDASFLREEAARRGLTLTDEQLKQIYADGRYLQTDEYKTYSGAK